MTTTADPDPRLRPTGLRRVCLVFGSLAVRVEHGATPVRLDRDAAGYPGARTSTVTVP